MVVAHSDTLRMTLNRSVCLLAIVATLLLFLGQSQQGFSLWDEGYLWYGVQRVLQGEVPIRDFMAYDPGRYYVSAALMHLSGTSGIVALRGVIAVVQAIGLAAGLLCVVHAAGSRRYSWALLATGILLVWMLPRHKLFDISLSILLVAVLSLLVAQPSQRRCFLSGLCVGAVAFFGRNHALYGAFGSIGVLLWLAIHPAADYKLQRSVLAWGLGLAAGFVPVILMLLGVDGFAAAFARSITFLFEIKTTNLPLPLPWPWTVAVANLSTVEAVRSILVGLFFVGTCIFAVVSTLWVIWQRWQRQSVPPVLVAAAFLSIPYTHFILSRADVGHLAQGIFPTLIGSLAILATQNNGLRWSSAVVLCLTSLWTLQVYHPGGRCNAAQPCTDIEVSGSTLRVDPATARDVGLLRSLASQHDPSRPLLAVPFWPGAYALLERKAPVWEIFPLFPRSAAFEHGEIARLQQADIGFAIVLDHPLDGRDELRFRNTHPLLYRHLNENFDRIDDPQNPDIKIFQARP